VLVGALGQADAQQHGTEDHTCHHETHLLAIQKACLEGHLGLYVVYQSVKVLWGVLLLLDG